jgi:hypothetical protein
MTDQNGVTHNVIILNRAQAAMIAEMLANAPASAKYHLDQTTNAQGRRFLYLHDRTLGEPGVLINQKGETLSLTSDEAFYD